MRLPAIPEVLSLSRQTRRDGQASALGFRKGEEEHVLKLSEARVLPYRSIAPRPLRDGTDLLRWSPIV
jgi:hypothetical protein